MSEPVLISPLTPAEVKVAVGGTLSVTADEGSAGFVLRHALDGSKVNKVWLNAGTPVTLGPYTSVQTFTVKPTNGTLRYSVAEPAPGAVVAALQETLPRATEIVRSQVVITKALNEGRRAMSLVDRMQNLAERAKAVPLALAERTDKSLARLDAVEQRGHVALDGIDSVITDAENASKATEDAVNQLTNGAPAAPPLPKSS